MSNESEDEKFFDMWKHIRAFRQRRGRDSLDALITRVAGVDHHQSDIPADKYDAVISACKNDASPRGSVHDRLAAIGERVYSQRNSKD